VLGLSLVVFVFAAVLMLSHGIEAALRSGGRSDNVVILRQGANTEITSAVSRDTLRALSILPEVAREPGGPPAMSGEIVLLIAMARADGGFTNVTVRGIGPASFAVRPGVRIVEGRMPRPGTREAVIGEGLAGRSPGAHVGGELSFAQTRWLVVGRMAASGAAYDSELWADADRLAQAFDRVGYSSVIARLSDASLVDGFKSRLESDPRFALKVVREDRYWADQASSTATFIRVLGLFVSVVFSAGATLGAMITMYAQVAARTRELAMMRALGFRPRSVLASFVIESGILGALGGLFGACAAFSMKWVRIETLNFQTFSQVRFGFMPTAGILAAAVGFGIAMGLAGGFLPALRAARTPILEAVRG
jgi:putative ABC transport system permease protein